jgi:RNA polymerase-binding transcription factor DksA
VIEITSKVIDLKTIIIQSTIKGGMLMSKREMLQLRETLLRQRREILKRLGNSESDRQSPQERDIELEEEAQKSDMTGLHNRLDKFAEQEIEEIDLALCKMATGSYGLCETCRKPISMKRLEAIPATRVCRKCARDSKEELNKLVPARAVITSGKVPSEYRNLSNDELEMLILERLREDGRLDLEELEVYCRKGVVYLKGILPNEAEHQILVKTLTDVLGFESIIDHLQICQMVWERDDHASGNLPHTANDLERLIYSMDELTDDVIESLEQEIPYILPERPQPDEE